MLANQIQSYSRVYSLPWSNHNSQAKPGILNIKQPNTASQWINKEKPIEGVL